MNKSLLATLFLGFVIFAFRFIPSPDNFSPLLALCLAVGYVSGGKSYGFIIPLVAMFIADLSFGLYPGWAFTYIPLVAIVALGTFSQAKPVAMTGLALGASLTFFLISNFGVWFSTGLYAKTFSGLWLCYAAALPFLHYTVISTLVFTALLFVPLFALWKGKQKVLVR